MKKIISLAAVFVLLICTASAERNFLSFSFGLSSGIPFYGTEESNNYAKELDSSSRFVIGTYALLNLNIVKTASVYSGAELISDFKWQNPYYTNHLHCDFPLGIRLSPGLAGFSFGTAYLLGFRGDFYKVEVIDENEDTSKVEKMNTATAWGNGFKFFLEYDFSYHGSQMLPTAGLSWTFMPRGNNEYDNLLQIYFCLNL